MGSGLKKPETPSGLDGSLHVGGVDFVSRLIVGTGKYKTNEVMVRAIRASEAEVVTVAVRRIDLDQKNEQGILHHLRPDEFFLLANRYHLSYNLPKLFQTQFQLLKMQLLI